MIIVTRERAIFRLKALGILTAVLAFASIYLQASTTIENTYIHGITNLSQTYFHLHTGLSVLSYLILLIYIVSGVLLIKLRTLGAKLILIASVSSFILFSLPIIFFFVPGFTSISVDASFNIEKLSGLAASAHALFGVCLFPLWAPPLAFKYFDVLNSTDPNDNDENERAFNKSIHTDAG